MCVYMWVWMDLLLCAAAGARVLIPTNKLMIIINNPLAPYKKRIRCVFIHIYVDLPIDRSIDQPTINTSGDPPCLTNCTKHIKYKQVAKLEEQLKALEDRRKKAGDAPVVAHALKREVRDWICGCIYIYI